MSTRTAALVLVAVLLLALIVATRHASGARREVGFGQVRYNGLGPEAWAARARHWRRELLELRRSLRQRPHVVEAINLSCATYGHCGELWRKAGCESGYSARAQSSTGAAGVFQFIGSTWRSTPYGVFSVWSPYANALAAGWMHANGRGGEWTCR